jgi:hypothetical protein
VREVPLFGGDVNVVVRVGDTVRRPVGPRGVQALLRWYEHVGFEGAPRFLYWTNVIFRDGLPVALIDWELAAPGSRLLDNLRWLEEHRDGLARFLA